MAAACSSSRRRKFSSAAWPAFKVGNVGGIFLKGAGLAVGFAQAGIIDPGRGQGQVDIGQAVSRSSCLEHGDMGGQPPSAPYSRWR